MELCRTFRKYLKEQSIVSKFNPMLHPVQTRELSLTFAPHTPACGAKVNDYCRGDLNEIAHDEKEMIGGGSVFIHRD